MSDKKPKRFQASTGGNQNLFTSLGNETSEVVAGYEPKRCGRFNPLRCCRKNCSCVTEISFGPVGLQIKTVVELKETFGVYLDHCDDGDEKQQDKQRRDHD